MRQPLGDDDGCDPQEVSWASIRRITRTILPSHEYYCYYLIMISKCEYFAESREPPAIKCEYFAESRQPPATSIKFCISSFLLYLSEWGYGKNQSARFVSLDLRLYKYREKTNACAMMTTAHMKKCIQVHVLVCLISTVVIICGPQSTSQCIYVHTSFDSSLAPKPQLGHLILGASMMLQLQNRCCPLN